jgi:hypothetical protein
MGRATDQPKRPARTPTRGMAITDMPGSVGRDGKYGKYGKDGKAR